MHHFVNLAPIATWAPNYDRRDLRGDVVAGVTIAALLIPQGLAYAVLAGLPPQIGLYASIAPVLAYACFGTSRQLAVGPVAIVSLMTATALAGLAEQGSDAYLAGAAVLALMVGGVHLLLRVARMGFLVDFLSHSVLVGFTAASALIIVASQIKHVLGVSIPRTDSFVATIRDDLVSIDGTHAPTVILGVACILGSLAIKRFSRRVPGALVMIVASIVAVRLFDLSDRGVATVGEIPGTLPGLSIPSADAGALGALATAAVAITLVGFVESIAVAKVYARRHRYEVDPGQELVGLGAANVASGLFGGLPVTGGFSRTAVSDAAGTRTPLASIVAAFVIIPAVLFLTPVFADIPQAALGATIMVAVVNLIDIREMRHIAAVKRSDLVGLGIAFVATLVVGIERGMLIAVVSSMLVVFARMSRPHAAVIGRIPDTTSYRNVDRFPEAEVRAGIRVVRIDAALSFVNANSVKRRCLAEAIAITEPPHALVIDCSGINDIDATGTEMLTDLVAELDESPITLHLCDVKGPVRDVMRRTPLWARFHERIHATAHQAVLAIEGRVDAPESLRDAGIDERHRAREHTHHPDPHEESS